MACVRCRCEIPEDDAFCQFCGAAQQAAAAAGPPGKRCLRRSQVDRQVGGVGGGIARYFDTDPVFVRVAWVILTIVPGAIFLSVLAYLVAWLIIPQAEPGTEAPVAESPGGSWRARRLYRSTTDAKIGGVCGGIAEYFAVDSTAVRLLWVVLSIFPGAIICGVLTYIVAWFIMPGAPVLATSPPADPTPAPGGEHRVGVPSYLDESRSTPSTG